MLERYAVNLRGIAQFCLDQHTFHKQLAESTRDEGTMDIATGRCYAYSEVLQLITGRKDRAGWEEVTKSL